MLAVTARLRALLLRSPPARALAAAAPAPSAAASAAFTPAAQQTDLLTALNREEMAAIAAKRAIPRFFAGSILRVVFTDFAGTKERSFTGVCIARVNRGLGSSFVLRNVVDGAACELRLETYDPLIVRFEVLRLARRRRAKLYYLRDRPDKESTVSTRMQAVPPPEDGRVPVIRAAHH